MIDWFMVRNAIVAGASLVLVAMAVVAIYASEFRKLSRRGVITFIIAAGIATGAAQKGKMRSSSGLRGLSLSSIGLVGESDLGQLEYPPAYTNPVRLISFSHSPTTTTADVCWDWQWSTAARYHYLNLYGSYSLSTNCWTTIGRYRIADWGNVTNCSVSINWPVVFSNAITSGTFPTNAALTAGFFSAFPELDTDGDGIYDGDEIRIYGSRWDITDSDGDGIDDPDELFDAFTDPTDPDTDGDGMPDGWEWHHQLDPTDPTDVLGDLDGDGLTNLEEANLGSDPDCTDTDGDLLTDYDEVRIYGTNPCLADTDGDGMDDREEVIGGFDPCFAGEYHGPELPTGYNSDAYYTVGIAADEPMTWVTFVGDGESNLADPAFFIRSNETVTVTLLMGKTYHVFATNAFSCIAADNSPVSVVTNTPCDYTIVRPVSVSLLPEFTTTALGAGSLGGDGSFRMGVYPDVGGVFDWTNSCCAITSRSNQFWFACSGQCACSGCFATGRLVYEGYSLPCVGGTCGCPRDDADLPTEADDQVRAASVTFAFSDRAVIFEDAYTNSPGEVVARRSTSTTLSCSAHGGPRGANLSLSLVNADKLVATSGPNLPSNTQFIPPGQKLEFEIEYEGVAPSAAADDISATATLVEEETAARQCVSNSITSVKIRISPEVVAPLNSSSGRHEFGVGERVYCKKWPNSDIVTWHALEGYMTNLASSVLYSCPQTYADTTLCASCRDVTYFPQLSVYEPEDVEAREVAASAVNGAQVGEAGWIILKMDLYILPETVSFDKIAVEEVPCTVGTHSGYFDNISFNNVWCHSVSNGAGRLLKIGGGNLMGHDEPGVYCKLERMTADGILTNDVRFGWTSGSLDWKIPFGWTALPTNSTPILEGTFAAGIHHTTVITTDGTVTTSKFGFSASRETNGVVRLNGRIIE